MLIGIVGFMGSGKGTVGDIIQKQGYVKDSFAKPLKDACAEIFAWDRKLLEGDSEESRKWRELPDEYWSKAFNRDFTPRDALQLLGTEGGRNVFHKDIWVHSLMKRAQDANTVVTDVRFRNEIEMIHDHGGKIVRIIRGPEVSWFEDAVTLNKGPKKNYRWASAKYNIQGLGIHSSEFDWVGCHIDYTIENNSTIANLELEVNRMLNDDIFMVK
jgi:hypothetical protein